MKTLIIIIIIITIIIVIANEKPRGSLIEPGAIVPGAEKSRIDVT